MFKKSTGLWALMHGYRGLYGAAIAALAGGTLLMYARPLIIAGVFDIALNVTADRTPELVRRPFLALASQEFWARNLWIPALLVVLLTVLSGVFTYLRGKWAAAASEGVCRDLRERLYNHIQRLPVSHFDKTDTGDLVQRCSSDVETIRMFLAVQVTEIGRSVLLVALAIPIMVALHPTMTLMSMIVLPVIVVFSAVFFLGVRRSFKIADESEAAMTATIQENLTGVRVVRAFARGEFEIERFRVKAEDYRDKWFRLIQLMAIFWSASDLLSMAQVGIVLYYGARQIAAGEMSIGTLVAFISFVHMFLWPIRQMGRLLTDLGKATVSLDRVEEILDAPEETDLEAVSTAAASSGDGTGAGPAARGAVSFRNVHFGHSPAAHVLRDLSFEIEPGRTLAIIGPSGAGKSTIINLLLRLYDHDTGEIRIDGREIRALPRRAVREQIGVVMQEPFLYSKTVRENIRIGRRDAGEEEVQRAASVAAVHESIAQFEQGYDTLVGERGVTLSGGQRQRVALARAILKDPPILVLDDALSAVDTRTEQMILTALRDRHGRHTTIVIAHRLGTLMHADRILVLDRGKVIQTGTHAELIQAEGMYRRLWQVQSDLEDDLRQDLAAATEKQ